MVPIFKPYMPKDILSEIEDNLYSGNLSFGVKAKMFEKSIGSYINNSRFLSTSSYNHALLIVISALGLKSGDEIIASPMSCLASNQPFAIKGLKIKWVDIDPNNGSICLDDLKSKLSSNTKAVFVNHYCGYLARQKEIYGLVKQYDIPLIDDAIESFGSKFGGKMIGNNYADVTVFSFQTVRLPNTIEGGGIAFLNEELYLKALKIRDYGIDRTTFRDELNEISKECDINLEGYGALMPEVNSIIGNNQMKDLDVLLGIQRINGLKWDGLISDIPGLKPLEVNSEVEPNYWVYGVLSDNKVESIVKFRELGFYATSVHINNNIYSVFRNNENLKGVNEFYSRFIAIPCGWWVKEVQIESFVWK
ncbi:aminotransferase DegT [Myroides marinus]|uniref:DegT/DnrJ/EryC1/StrS family aminotransferase n=1 Tax=Myroides marinus TaxID=703342 RepID=UPI000741E353|nr:aminotransferase class V-fold PLP-dependent enzyme [Myroides marinus]KUF42856.1 aminotransferase DegT [Myroides marinus]